MKVRKCDSRCQRGLAVKIHQLSSAGGLRAGHARPLAIKTTANRYRIIDEIAIFLFMTIAQLPYKRMEYEKDGSGVFQATLP
jgi:hypothetical protein